MTIAIVGGHGDVGAPTVRHLVSAGVGPLRIGGRDAASAERFVATLGGAAVDVQAVDVLREDTLRPFVRGARVVVNCAGPSRLVGDRVAVTALRAGADYVDAAGDDALHALLDDAAYRRRGRVAVLSAGFQPGLTGLLPRWLAGRGFTTVTGLASYVGLLDRFTATAADDYLWGATEKVSEPLAAWREGPRSGVLCRRQDVDVPFFPERATVLPHLDREGQRLARSLGLVRGDWFTVVTGRHVLTAFNRAASLDRREAADGLCRASMLDLAGRQPYACLVVELEGARDGAPMTRTAVLRGGGNADLTGAVAALATRAVDQGSVPGGRHFAAGVLDPTAIVKGLVDHGVIDAVTVLETSIAALTAVEEGAL